MPFRRDPGAQVQAEALVWRHGGAGVEAARRQESLARSLSLETRLMRWMMRVIAERSYDLLTGLDSGTRYEVVGIWASRPGQMILPVDRVTGAP